MKSDISISVRGLSKSYTIVHNEVKHSTLTETLLHRLRRPFAKAETETFWALRDVSFDIQHGDVVGVIGRNGAGKSTLLKVLSQITEPTGGEIDIYGRVGSLLEVGTGFHAELSGRENIYLNGAILGMRRSEIQRQFDAIVDFAGIEQFLDTPVKRYSSGMYVRLAFAVAAHLSSDVLIVDEVLAVGDAEFQKKCLGKMKDVAQSGRTVLFVSHHMQSVSVLCGKALYLERGQVRYLGEVPTAIDYYLRSFEKSGSQDESPVRRSGTGELRITSAAPAREHFESGEEKVVHFTIERVKPFTGKFYLSCLLMDELGFTVLHCDSRLVGHWIEVSDKHEGRLRIRSPWLKPGSYRLDLFVCSSGIIDRWETACVFEVSPLLPYPAAGNSEATALGVVFADFAYESTEDPQIERCKAPLSEVASEHFFSYE